VCKIFQYCLASIFYGELECAKIRETCAAKVIRLISGQEKEITEMHFGLPMIISGQEKETTEMMHFGTITIGITCNRYGSKRFPVVSRRDNCFEVAMMKMELNYWNVEVM
jgi:NAD-dependent dihydropyrimidine dehydrogenase PreA subunit